MKHLRGIRNRYDPEQLSVVSITQETDRTAIASFWREYDGEWPAAIDPTMRTGRRYGVTSIPTIVILGPDGTERSRHTGLVTESTLVDAVDAVLGSSTD